jgi:hypothetical protein
LNPSPGWGKVPATLVTLQVAVPPNPYVLELQPPLLVMLAMGIAPTPTPPPGVLISTRSGTSPKPVMVATPPVHVPDPVLINPIVPGHPPVLRIAVRLAEASGTSGLTAVEDTSGSADENPPVAVTPTG